jgi:hypothetical protein
MKITIHLAAGALLSLTGCTELTHLGVSGEISPIRSEDSALSAPRYFTTISLPEGVRIAPNGRLGDVDGDGLDDLLLGLVEKVPDGSTEVPELTVYLFYGRAAAPEQLSYEDADATFETGYTERMSLGDVNGDGRADFGLGDETGYEIIFGSPARYSGHHAKFTAGTKWIYGEPAGANSWGPGFFRHYSINPGDINGDGADEIVLAASVQDATSRVGYTVEFYLIEGRAADWPSGAWDFSWPAARFGGDDPMQKPYPTSSGDIDGDGYSDIVTFKDDRYWLYYGGPRGLEGTQTESIADAELATAGAYPAIVGDIDGDGADDIQISPFGDIKIVYGSTTRYSGVATLEPGLTFPGTSGAVQIGDYNADGLNDLLISASSSAASELEVPTTPPVLYELRGTGTRLTGQQTLQPAQLYRPVGYAAPEAVSNTGSAEPIGDFDGDGSTDLIASDWNEHGTATAVYLLPGIGPEPD